MGWKFSTPSLVSAGYHIYWEQDTALWYGVSSLHDESSDWSLEQCPIPASKEGEKEVFYLTMQSTHFIYSYMASDIW